MSIYAVKKNIKIVYTGEDLFVNFKTKELFTLDNKIKIKDMKLEKENIIEFKILNLNKRIQTI